MPIKKKNANNCTADMVRPVTTALTNGCRSRIFLNKAHTAFLDWMAKTCQGAGREVTWLESQDKKMSLSHTHDFICHFKRMEKVLFRIGTLLWDICRLLGDSIWKAIACFSSPLLAQLVRDCMSRRHRISCEQEEFLAAPCVGLEWQKGLEQDLSLFQGACENFPTLCLWEVKGTFSKPFLSQVRKPSNETQGPVPSAVHHRSARRVSIRNIEQFL